MNYIEVLDSIDAAVWGPPMIILLLGCHIYTTIRTKGIQRKLPLALKLSVTKDNGAQGDVSNFGAMATSLASTLGTGSIVGVATAVLSGGPGAVLWMWLTGILGMATKYTEVYAAMKYRVKDRQGHMMGGAMHVWEQRYKRSDGTVPWWAKFMVIWFAVMACLTIFGVGSAVQTSAITSVAQANFGVEPWIVAAIVCGSALLIIMGGLGTISNICEKLVPIMGVAYILGCAYILVCNWAFIGESFRLIFECAFTPRAAFGGAVGSGIIVALQFGCARGLFSNEAGLGTAPLISAAAESKNPASGARVHDGPVLVHGGHLLRDRLGHRLVAVRPPHAHPGCRRHQRCHARQRRVRHHPLCGRAHPHAGHPVLRLFHYHRVELLRRTRHPVPVRPPLGAAVPGLLHLHGLFGRRGRRRRGLDGN